MVDDAGAVTGCTRQTLQQLVARGALSLARRFPAPSIPQTHPHAVDKEINCDGNEFVDLFHKSCRHGQWTKAMDEILVQASLSCFFSLLLHYVISLNFHLMAVGGAARLCCWSASAQHAHEPGSNTCMYSCYLFLDEQLVMQIETPEQWLEASKASLSSPVDCTPLMRKFFPLKDVSATAMRIRMNFIVHVNDLILPLLPLLNPVTGNHGSNSPSEQIYRLKHLLFTQVLL